MRYLLDKFYNKIIIKGTLVGLSAIHIGTGQEGYSPQDVDNGIIRNGITGEPFIPGSSLKGMLRTYCESLLPSIDRKYENCCIVTENPCLEKRDDKARYTEDKDKIVEQTVRQIKDKFKDNPKRLGEVLYDNVCPICRVFGSQAMASKIQINDAPIKGKYIIEKRYGVAIDRDSGTAAFTKNYNFECISAGAEFDFCMTINNIEDDYKEVVEICLNYLKSGEVKIGGRKSIGLGAIQLKNVECYQITKENLRQYAREGLKDEMRDEACLKS
ncbi:type III CRISPR-associated RAMP protein Csx7 [Cellulosilyticum ruminicola]|uniref:type III CRISPR-associated RAMP protein Csx7 n=1 Tax=Cellulosilyticum ruminicola TaxID=425254 RepID=UPI0006D03E15|nr:CRISPR-associated RAMP protein Csx7 [Cellulosilyticum ruminicola]